MDENSPCYINPKRRMPAFDRVGDCLHVEWCVGVPMNVVLVDGINLKSGALNLSARTANDMLMSGNGYRLISIACESDSDSCIPCREITFLDPR